VSRVLRLRALVPAALAAALAWKWSRTPTPSPEEDQGEGLAREEWSFTTADGVTLRGKRYAVPGAVPVLLVHGFEGNGNEFDLPRPGRNLAVFLAREGFDVWIANFRGNGRAPAVSDSGGWRHSIDHLAAYDADALVRGVTEATGRKPVWVGHSMGGMVLFGYLQGASFQDGCFAADEGLARERNGLIAAGVAIGSPPAFYWEQGGFFGLLSNSPVSRAALRLLMAVLRLLEKRGGRISLGVPVGRWAERHPKAAAALALSPAGILLYNWRNVEADAAVSLLRWAGDDVSASMARQLIFGIVNHDYLSYDRRYDYTANMGRITVPMLFVTGTEDFASFQCIRRYGYERVFSPRKDFICFPGYGHTDLVMGKGVEEKVYPAISAWLKETVP